MSVDLDNPGDCAQWARLLEAATKERNDLRAEVASMARGYRDLHDMLPGNKDVWSKVDDLRTALATALAERDGCGLSANHSQAHNALVVAYEALDLLEGFAPEDTAQLRWRADFIRRATRSKP